MKIVPFLIISLLFSTVQAETLFISNRAFDDREAQTICNKLVSDCAILESETKDFGDKSIFFQIKGSVVGKNVVVLLPEDYKSSYFLEALIKIRTAQALGARSVFALATRPLPDFAWYLTQVAGADFSVEQSPASVGEELRFTQAPLQASKKTKSHLSLLVDQTIVYSTENSSFAKKLGHNLKAQIITESNELVESLRGINCQDKARVIVISQWDLKVGSARLINDLELVSNLKKSLTSLGCSQKEVLLIFPYLPYSRGDKVDHEKTIVTGRLIADLVEAAGPDMVLFSRLHASQVQGFFTIPTLHISGRETINSSLKTLELDAIISPDAGFQKEATRYADELGLPVYVLNKKRHKDGSIQFKTMGTINLKGKRVAIIDDETASGGTLGEAAQYLKARGAVTVYGVVTHLAGNASKAIQDPALDHIFVTSTLVSESPDPQRLSVLEIADEFSKAIIHFLPNNKIECGSFL